MGSALQEIRTASRRGAAEWLTEKLSRVTSSREFIPEVDGLRFLALLPVLILHSTTHFLIWRGWADFNGDWTRGHGVILHVIGTGSFGVQIFFVISGFVVALPFARYALQGEAKPSLSRYFMRRLTRIEPPYIISLVAMYLLWRNFRGYLPDLLAGLFYMHKFALGTRNPINTVTWTLEIEVTFYLLAPWLTRIYLVPDRAFRWLLQFALIAIYSYSVFRWIIPHCPARVTDTLVTQLPYFLAGILLADLYASGMVRRSRMAVCDFIALASAGLLVYCCMDGARFFWTTPILLMGLFLGGFQGWAVNEFLRFRPVTIIGGMCYTAYLWHTAMLVLLRGIVARAVPSGLPDGEAALVFCILMVPILIVLTAPIFYFVEKPFMNGPGSRAIERALRTRRSTTQIQPVD